jgi:hypothetical protein
METLLRYRGRAVTRDEVHQIRTLVAAHPEQSRRALSETLCSAWDWRQANGASRAMVCRGLMLALWCVATRRIRSAYGRDRHR